MKKINFSFILLLLIAGISFAQSTVQYTESDEIFPNPERGFYKHTENQSETSTLDVNTLKAYRAQNHTLILRLYYFKKFKNSPLSQKQLDIITADFQKMRDAGIKCILRFAYSQNENEADAPLSIIYNHLEQLKPIFESNYDVIAFMQAGFIGAWGEWYYSSNNLNTTTNRRNVLYKILDILPKERTVQVRTPLYKKLIFNYNEPLSESNGFDTLRLARTGHHNDCFLAAWDDWGTYVDTTSEKKYLRDECLYVPIGGETCSPSSFSGCTNALYESERLRFTYLNRDYHQVIISGWRNSGCYDELSKFLGYRFVMKEGNYSTSLKQGSGYKFNLKLENKGFAPFYNYKITRVILRSALDAREYYVDLPLDARYWQPKKEIELDYEIGVPASLPDGDYSIYLALIDSHPTLERKSNYSIRFANTNSWEAKSGYNSLNSIVTINSAGSGSEFTGDLFFKELDNGTSVEDERSEVIDTDYLRNYPNPFNGATNIVFTLKEAATVTLKIYNSLGQEIAILLNEYTSVGKHQYNFNSANISSGVYYYVLSTGEKNITGKMLLLK
jgi:hypothetical protein